MSVKRTCTFKKKYALINYRYFNFKIVSLAAFSPPEKIYSERQKKLYIFKKSYTLINYRYFNFKIVSSEAFKIETKKNYKIFRNIVNFFRAHSLSDKN